VCLTGRPARCNLIIVSTLPMFGSCKQLTQDTNTNKFSYANYHWAWLHHRNMASLPRSRLAEHGEHPAHFVHLHFFSQLFEFLAHQDLQSPAAWELVVVVIVSVVVTGFSSPWHEQQGSPVMSFVHLSHSKDPPCATQALTSLSSSHVGSVGAGVGAGVGAEVDGDEVDVHGTGGIHVHLPSLAK